MSTLYQMRREMRQLARDEIGDPESDHVHADQLLIEAIRLLAKNLSADPTLWQAEAEDLIEAYHRVKKWYA